MEVTFVNGQLKRPMTTAEYFNKDCNILKEKRLMPEKFQDYTLATRKPVPMKTYEFSIRNNLDYGVVRVFIRIYGLSSMRMEKSRRMKILQLENNRTNVRFAMYFSEVL